MFEVVVLVVQMHDWFNFIRSDASNLQYRPFEFPCTLCPASFTLKASNGWQIFEVEGPNVHGTGELLQHLTCMAYSSLIVCTV